MGKFAVIRRFGVSLIKLYPGRVAAYILFSFLSQTAIPLVLPLLLAEVTNAFQPSAAAQPSATAHPYVVPAYFGWLTLTFALIPIGIAFRVAQTDMDSRMEKQLRTRLFDKIIRQSPEFFRRYNPGELSNVLNQSTVEAQMALRSLLVDPILQVISIAIAMSLIVFELRTINATVVWPVVLTVVLVGVATVWLVQKKGEKPVFEAQNEAQQQRFTLAGLTDSAVKSPEEIQAMDAEPFFASRHEQGLDRMIALKRRQALTMEWLNSAIGLPTQIILAALYGFIVYEAMHGGKSIQPGVFIALAGLTPQLMQPFRTFAALGMIASSSWPAVELVTRLLDEDNRIKDVPGAKDIPQADPTLEVRKVNFRYAAELPKVFDDLDFSVPPGSITALVARMGQGKTSFFRLALRFYEPDSGDILLGGFPVRTFTLKSLREHAVMMSQFPAFFHDTVRNNFLVARPDATDEDIRRVCEQTRLWPMLESAIGPQPLDSPFAAGQGLSGGQRRLFALTRCLLRNPTFLFMDEPTTNMSNDEKFALIPVMRAACAGRTVIVVDHDIPWLLRFCDHFVVLDNGRIAQQGTAEELLAGPGVLSELYAFDAPAPAAPSGEANPVAAQSGNAGNLASHQGMR
jgi:ATP-binding cassette subfamily B protein